MLESRKKKLHDNGRTCEVCGGENVYKVGGRA